MFDMRDQRTRPDPTEEVGEIYQTGVKPGAVTLTQHLPVQRKARSDARSATATPEAPAPEGFGFIQAYGGNIKSPGGAAFPDEQPTPWMAGGGGGGGGAPLPAPVQAKMEHAFDADLSSVRVHEGSEAGALGAQAFAQGTDIHFAPGHYDPGSTAGQELIGHELAHVVQQSQGRVTSGRQNKGGAAVNDDPSLEREADEMGARAARGERVGTRVDGPLASTAVRQLKREPITGAGMSIVTLAKQYFALAKDKNGDKTALAALGKKITTDANALDVTKEKNEDFLYVLKIFKIGLHDRDSEDLRVEVEKKFTFLSDEITAESKNEVDAKALELAEGGHALDRHGPAVGDDALIRRLHTGIAPDNVLVPAPGASSRFNSYTDYLETRQKAAALLQQEILTAAGKVLTWLTTVGGLAGVHATAHAETLAKGLALTTATTEKTDAFKPTSGLDKTQKEAKLNAFKQAGTDKKNAEGAEKTAKDEMDHPGKNLKRVLPGMTKVKLTIDDDVDDAASLEDGVTLADSYGINAQHGKPIGTAFTSDDSIKLSDILSKVSTGDPPQPKPPGEITAALTAEGFAGDLPAFVAFLSDPANLADVKKRGEKGAKIYKTATSSGPLTMSYTLLQRGGTGKLFDGAGQPLAIDTAGWQAIQHFPAPPGAVAGVEA
jgi:hypothetical protein